MLIVVNLRYPTSRFIPTRPNIGVRSNLAPVKKPEIQWIERPTDADKGQRQIRDKTIDIRQTTRVTQSKIDSVSLRTSTQITLVLNSVC